MENELAIIAIKGGRYDEAESIFNNEVQNNPTYHSYFGLGVCKLNLLLNINRTVDEIIYCFEKSLNLADKKEKKEIENQISVFINTILIQYKELYLKLEDEKKKQANKALLGAALTIGAAAVGSGKNANAFTQIASLAAAGVGVGISLDGIDKLGEIPEIQKYILKCASKLTNKFSLLCTNEDNKLLLTKSNNDLINALENQKIEKGAKAAGITVEEFKKREKAEKELKAAQEKEKLEKERKRIEKGAKEAGITVEEFQKKENRRFDIIVGIIISIIIVLCFSYC